MRMSLFRRPRTERDQIDRIHALAQRVYASRGLDGELVLDPDDPFNASIHTSAGVYGLSNITLDCLNVPPRQWRALLGRWADKLIASRHLPDIDLDRDRSALRARLYPEDASVSHSISYGRPFAPRLVEALAIDTPQMVSTLSAHALEGYDLDDLFAVGRENLAFEQIDSRDELEDAIILLSGESFFVASLVLTPERLRAELGGAPRGFVFVIPDRHTILAHAVREGSLVDGGEVPVTIRAVQRLSMFGHTTSADHRPGGLLSREVFYSRGDDIEQITMTNPDNGIPAISEDFLSAFNLR